MRTSERVELSSLLQIPHVRGSGGCEAGGDFVVIHSAFSRVAKLLPECPLLQYIDLSAPQNNFKCAISETEGCEPEEAHVLEEVVLSLWSPHTNLDSNPPTPGLLLWPSGEFSVR